MCCRVRGATRAANSHPHPPQLHDCALLASLRGRGLTVLLAGHCSFIPARPGTMILPATMKVTPCVIAIVRPRAPQVRLEPAWPRAPLCMLFAATPSADRPTLRGQAEKLLFKSVVERVAGL